MRTRSWRIKQRRREASGLIITTITFTSITSTALQQHFNLPFSTKPTKLPTIKMRASIIIASVFAAFAAAAPVESPAAVEIEARQDVNTQVVSSIHSSESHILMPRKVRNVRVQFSQDATDTAVQANIAGNNAKISIQANFGGLGNPVKANRALVVGSSKGSCK
jgi:hypothetical protein